MSEQTKDIRDIREIRDMVIPFGRCPQLYDDQTLDHAIALFALDSPDVLQDVQDAQEIDQANFPSYLPLLLVLDRQNNLVGQLSRIDILRGLVPSLLGMGMGIGRGKEGKESSPSWTHTAHIEDPHLTYLYEDHALAECGGNRASLVRSLMRPIDFTLPANMHILEAIVLLHRHNASCVPVIEHGAVIGILRFKELFHAMCNTWCTLPQK
ncbi:MAG: CBS domain-containing protein [Candidatus Electrothrix sp. AUS3]|nr:CBS domain-containing protein [Candidatus Electrothrix gigas]